MGIFKDILNDLKNRDPDTLDLLQIISTGVDENSYEEFDSSLLSDVSFIIEEQLISGYLVLYQYRQKAILEKNKDGNDVESTVAELMIISVIEPLSKRVIDNDDIKATIKSKIHEMKIR